MKMFVEKDGELKQIQTEDFDVYARRGWNKSEKTEASAPAPKKGKKRPVEEPTEIEEE